MLSWLCTCRRGRCTPGGKCAETVSSFLNRLLALPLGQQELLFDFFNQTMVKAAGCWRLAPPLPSVSPFSTCGLKFHNDLSNLGICLQDGLIDEAKSKGHYDEGIISIKAQVGGWWQNRQAWWE